MGPEKILNFWFSELTPKQHWVKDESLDELIVSRFSEIHEKAANNELFQWRHTPDGCLAEVIILDQFSRNIYRNQPRAFAQDPQALALSQWGVQTGIDKKLPLEQRHFYYMPFMHSESQLIHEEALKLFSQKGLNPEFEIKHKVIIDQFRRYPHRNAILGRESSQEEIDFLKKPGSSF